MLWRTRYQNPETVEPQRFPGFVVLTKSEFGVYLVFADWLRIKEIPDDKNASGM
jgi:hypothetical protein